MSLKRFAISGTRWITLSSVITAPVQLGQMIILARLLQPSDFGLFAMILLMLFFAESYADLGFNAAIIQKQDTTPEQLSSLYWTNIISGWAVFGLMVAATPIAVALFMESRLYILAPMAALTFLISPWGNQYNILLQKELRFRTLAIIEVTSTLVSALVAIIAALGGLGVLSLVLCQLSSVGISTILLVAIGWQQWSPKLRLRWADLDNYLSFGLYQMGWKTLHIIGTRIDQFLIGALLGAEALGYYSLAWNLIIQPASKINPILTRVAFPLFARVQDDTERLQRGYLLLLRIVSMLSAPILFGFAAIALMLVPFIYGEKWTPAVSIIQILATVGVISTIIHPIGMLMLARGRPDLGLKWTLSIVVLQIPVIYIGLYIGGLTGVALSVLFLNVVYLFAVYWFLIRRMLGDCFRLYLGSVLPAQGLAAAMAILVWLLSLYITASAPIALAIQITAGVLTYSILMLLFQRSWLLELLALLGSRIGSQRSSTVF